jgi:hypothetical protein
MAKKYVFVIAASYNGYKNVPFMMEADDFRLDPSWTVSKWTVVDANPVFDRKARTMTVKTGVYTVCSDFSVKKING